MKVKNTNEKDIEFTQVIFDKLKAIKCLIKKCVLRDVELPVLKLKDASVQKCSFSDAQIEKMRLRDLNIQQFRMQDANIHAGTISDCNLHDLSIVDCRMDGLRINGIPVADLLAAYAAAQGTGD